MDSTQHHKRVVAGLSPVTLEFFNRLQLLEQQPYTEAEKIELRARMAAVLTPEQRQIVEREALAAAISLQHSQPSRGNRAERRKVKKNLRAAQKRGE